MADEVDVDALYNAAMGEGDHGEIPMSSEPTPEPVALPEFEFTHKDKQIKTKFDDPKLKMWASQGYDYAQRVESFKKETQAFEEQRQSVLALEKEYKEINQYAKENPDKWKSLFEKWKASVNQEVPQSNIPPEVQQKLQKYDEYFQKLEQKEQQETIQREDSALDAEIKSIREKYPNLDFDAPSHDGKSLEYRVVEHADKNGIKSFKTAFNDFYHENLLKLAEEKGKETVSKDIQKKTKLGILKTSAPTKQVSQRDVRGMSYEDILNEVKTEYNVN